MKINKKIENMTKYLLMTAILIGNPSNNTGETVLPERTRTKTIDEIVSMPLIPRTNYVRLDPRDMIIDYKSDKKEISNPEEFIDYVKDYALSIQEEYGIPASISIAQAAHETGWEINEEYNLFGIKASPKDEESEKSLWKTHEYVKGKKIPLNDYFKRYNSTKECFEDYAKIITSQRYEKAMKYKNDLSKFVAEIQRLGYASDHNYSRKIMNIIKDHDLRKYDLKKKELDTNIMPKETTNYFNDLKVQAISYPDGTTVN